MLRADPPLVVGALVLVGCVAGASGVVLDRRLRRARSLALRDPLTELPNRVLLEDRIQQALTGSQRSGEPFTVICVDLDGFKDVTADVVHVEAVEQITRTARSGAASRSP